MRRIIDGREAAIAREYERSANPWIPCFISVGFQLETYLRELGQENWNKYHPRIKDFKIRCSDLMRDPSYHEKEYQLEPEVREELLGRLDIFADEYPYSVDGAPE